MITTGTTAHPFTRMAGASHTLMMLLLVHKCYRGLQINTSQPNKHISWWTTCPGRIQWKICPSIGNIVPRVAGWPVQTLMSVPTASLHRPQPISRQASVLLLLTTSNDGTAPRTAPETWTFSDAYWTSPMQRESDVLSILLLLHRKKKLLCGFHYMNEKGFNHSETSLKTSNKKCYPKLVLLLFVVVVI